MPGFIVGEKRYDVHALTLGEHRVLKREFGVQTIDALNPADPDHLVGLLYVMERRKRPNLTVEEIEREVENATTIEVVEDEGEEHEAGPTPES